MTAWLIVTIYLAGHLVATSASARLKIGRAHV